MGCSSAWSTGITVDPAVFIIFTALMFIACILGTILVNVLLRSEDEQVRQAQLRAQQEDFDGWHMIKRKWSIWPLVWIVFFVGLFAVGMRHY